MTTEEAKQAFFSEKPVIFDNIEYVRISALIYKKKEGQKPHLLLELLDQNKRSTMTTYPHRVYAKGDETDAQTQDR